MHASRASVVLAHVPRQRSHITFCSGAETKIQLTLDGDIAHYDALKGAFLSELAATLNVKREGMVVVSVKGGQAALTTSSMSSIPHMVL